jgi:hypothetical protein
VKLAALLVIATMAGAPARGQVAGTDAVAICKGAPCTPDDTVHAVAWGRVVLFAEPINLAALPDSARRLLDGMHLRAPTNGCSIMRHAPHAQTYAGVTRGTRWESVAGAADRITLVLHRSPDASHDALLRVTSDGLNGTGRSRGAGVEGALARREEARCARILCVPLQVNLGVSWHPLAR